MTLVDLHTTTPQCSGDHKVAVGNRQGKGVMFMTVCDNLHHLLSCFSKRRGVRYDPWISALLSDKVFLVAQSWFVLYVFVFMFVYFM